MPKIRNWSRADKKWGESKENIVWKNDKAPAKIIIEKIGSHSKRNENWEAWVNITDERYDNIIPTFDKVFRNKENARRFAVKWMESYPLTERVEYMGYLKTRWRCPECYRGLIGGKKGHCPVHIRDFNKPIDLKKEISQNDTKVLKEVHSYTKKSEKKDLVPIKSKNGA